eukprot:TRINITY_DN13182_c0_g1_i10.p1 TRINITY_DN13182_c0_g1~~TRINITY_DN13182_c0_g1_i10.p1  ORF type:complete len:103 (+),score=7.33 TRINITY_DN13182_c0_g1_i10:429-737(+)
MIRQVPTKVDTWSFKDLLKEAVISKPIKPNLPFLKSSYPLIPDLSFGLFFQLNQNKKNQKIKTPKKDRKSKRPKIWVTKEMITCHISYGELCHIRNIQRKNE